jgi:outer membrane receptor protein involved in Fe transport
MAFCWRRVRATVEAISLNNVERIEVLRGAAPGYFGTTAFAGTINVIHYGAGSADRVTSVRFAATSRGVGGAAVLSAGRVRQSISAEVSKNNLSDERADYGWAQGNWRWPQLGGKFRADADCGTAPSPTVRRHLTKQPERSQRCCP